MRKFNYIDLFSGVGGLSLGLEMAGFENLSKDKTVRGIIIGDSCDKKFDFALSGIQDNTIHEKIKFFKHPFSDKYRPPHLKAN